jgi:polygalacturonase
MGMKYREPSQNITIRNCRMVYGHGAVVLGSEMSGGIRNLSVSQCLFEETDRGLRIKTRRGRGESAFITDILFEKILMNHVKNPFIINMFYFCDEDGKTEYVYSNESLPVDERTPYLGNFIFKDIICTNVHHSAGFFYGLPEKPIKSITFDNVKISYTENVESGYPAMMSYIEKKSKLGIFARNVNHLILKNLEISGSSGNDIIVKQKTFK